jgi:hypothetical protein
VVHAAEVACYMGCRRFASGPLPSRVVGCSALNPVAFPIQTDEIQPPPIHSRISGPQVSKTSNREFILVVLVDFTVMHSIMY